jgi:hypothetical protein
VAGDPATDANQGYFVYLAAAISARGGLPFGDDFGVMSDAILFIQKEFGRLASMEDAPSPPSRWIATLGTPSTASLTW